MTTPTRTLARAEREALCDLALQLGSDRPTLCGDWTVKDLLVHLLVREGSPASLGIAVAPLAGWTERVSRRVGRASLPALVERLRSGPPRLSPFSLPKLDELGNGMEFFIHHEDLRRAQEDWEPRELGPDVERQLWSSLKLAGRGPTRKANVGIVAANATTGSTAVFKKGSPSVTVRGRPSEIALFAFGRTAQARVEVSGDGLDVTTLGA